MRVLGVCLLALGVAADADKVVKMRDFEGDSAKEVKVKVVKAEMAVKQGEAFSVKLESNPSTGFRWRLLGPDYGPLALKKAHFEKAAGDKAGAPGMQVFDFTAQEKGQQIVLIFNYGRPFEGLGERCYELKVKVSE